MAFVEALAALVERLVGRVGLGLAFVVWADQDRICLVLFVVAVVVSVELEAPVSPGDPPEAGLRHSREQRLFLAMQ